jgi:hypothetical protein
MRTVIALTLLLGLMGAAAIAANVSFTQFGNATIPAGGYLLDGSAGKLYQNADGTGFLLAR